MKEIDVAVGIVFNKEGKVLITKRGLDSPYPDLWEFPGGKLEENESAASAVVRELKEELGIHCQEIVPWLVDTHQYPDCHVRLHVFLVTAYSGKVACLENQQGFEWVELDKLGNFEFPEGNLILVQELAKMSLTDLFLGTGFCLF